MARKLSIEISERLAADLEARAHAAGISLEAWLGARIPLVRDELATRSQSAWLSREKWRGLIDGSDCPMCRDLAKPDVFLSGRLVIAQNAAGILVLSPNQGIPGYCVLYAQRHVTEPYLLDEGARREWLELWMSGARAIGGVYAPDKLNYQVLGNVVPHLHAHLIPRYYGDRAPAAPISPDAEPRMLGDHEIDERVRALREALRP